jgi:hypothetical protein
MLEIYRIRGRSGRVHPRWTFMTTFAALNVAQAKTRVCIVDERDW